MFLNHELLTIVIENDVLSWRGIGFTRLITVTGSAKFCFICRRSRVGSSIILIEVLHIDGCLVVISAGHGLGCINFIR